MPSTRTSRTVSADPGSFRDRGSRVFQVGGRVHRALSPAGLAGWEALESSGLLEELTRAGLLVASERVEAPGEVPPAPAGERWVAFLEHERVPFVSYPYEWSFGMLRDAARLTLDVQAAALERGLILKDATPYNVQWLRGRPVFIDVGSFELLKPGAPWAGYRQFCELFLYPLFLQAYKHAPFQPWLRGSLEGIRAEEMRGLCSLRDLVRPGVFAHVALQAALNRSLARSERDLRKELKASGFRKELIQINVRKLQRLLAGLEWNPSGSTWSDYTETNTYDDATRTRKAAFVRRAAAGSGARLVWDLGSNTGEYARVAAESAELVLAMDADHLSVEHMHRALAKDGPANILPLVVPLTDSSPGLGWQGRERRDLVARGRPDLALALALVHHVVIGAHVPLPEFVDWLADLGPEFVIEFVTKDDPQVKRLLRNKDDVYADYDQAVLEACLERRGEVLEREVLQDGLRTLYRVRTGG